MIIEICLWFALLWVSASLLGYFVADNWVYEESDWHEESESYTGKPTVTVQDARGVNALEYISGGSEGIPCFPGDRNKI